MAGDASLKSKMQNASSPVAVTRDLVTILAGIFSKGRICLISSLVNLNKAIFQLVKISAV